MVRTPVITQAMSIQPGLLIMRAMSAETMKMPDPIMTPMVIMTESKRLRPRTKPWSDLRVGAGWLIREPYFIFYFFLAPAPPPAAGAAAGPLILALMPPIWP